jgi:hypothetical protein
MHRSQHYIFQSGLVGKKVKTLENHANFKQGVAFFLVHLYAVYPVMAVKEQLVFNVNLAFVNGFQPV